MTSDRQSVDDRLTIHQRTGFQRDDNRSSFLAADQWVDFLFEIVNSLDVRHIGSCTVIVFHAISLSSIANLFTVSSTCDDIRHYLRYEFM